MRRRSLIVIACLLASTPARAESEADRLFKKGQKLLAAGEIAAACDAFEASDVLDSRVGTLLNLGDCREQNGQLATAWATFLRAASLAQQQKSERKRADEARRRAGYLQPRLSYLTISVSDASDLEGLVITRDGAPVERVFWNTGVPVDGGTYVIEASTPGQDPWSTTVEVAPENASAVVEIPRLQPLDDLADSIAPPPAPEPAPEREEIAAAPRRRRLTPLRIGALAAGGGAIAGVIVGAFAGVAASHDAAAARAICDDPCTSPEGKVLIASSQSNARLSTVSFVGAAVLAAGAITLWVVGRPAAIHDRVTVTPEVGRDHASVTFSLEL